MSTNPTTPRNPKNCFACLKRAATRNALLSVLISGGFLSAAIYALQMS